MRKVTKGPQARLESSGDFATLSMSHQSRVQIRLLTMSWNCGAHEDSIEHATRFWEPLMRTAVSSARLGPARDESGVSVAFPAEARCAYPGLSHLPSACIRHGIEGLCRTWLSLCALQVIVRTSFRLRMINDDCEVRSKKCNKL